MSVEDAREQHFGKDCPKGKVQVEFVSVDPSLRISDYGWKPSDHARIEISVDGQLFQVVLGDVVQFDGTKRRGLHVFIPMGAEVARQSINTVSVLLEAVTPVTVARRLGLEGA